MRTKTLAVALSTVASALVGCSGGGGGGGGFASSVAPATQPSPTPTSSTAPVHSSSTTTTTTTTTTPGRTPPIPSRGTTPSPSPAPSTSPSPAPSTSPSPSPAPSSSPSPSPRPGTITPLALPSGPVGGAPAEGIDVSEYQGTIGWSQVAAAKPFAIARVSDGLQHPDPYFATNWAQMKSNGMIRGVYQFFRGSEDGVQQADYLLSKVGTLGPGDLPPFCDVEVLDGVSSTQLATQVAAWCGEIKAKTGLTASIYTGRGFWNGNSMPNMGMNDLWDANWGVTSPAIPSGWHDWTFWQYTDKGPTPGIASPDDCDRFHGTLDDLRAYAGMSVASDFIRGVAIDSTGQGYWTTTKNGAVFPFGDATFRGTAGGKQYPQPLLGIVRTPTGFGYWLFGADGNVVPFGDAVQAGNLAGSTLAAPIVGLAATPSGQGYWLAAQDGTVTAFGATTIGSATSPTNAIVGIAPTPSGNGYFLASADGNVYAFGDAALVGTALGKVTQPIVGIAATPTGKGYFLAQSDGTVFNFGDAGTYPYTGALTRNAPIVSITPSQSGLGYYLVAGDGTVFTTGDAIYCGPRAR